MSAIPAGFWTKGNKSKALVKGKWYLVKRVCDSNGIYYYVEQPSIMNDGTLEFDTTGACDIGYWKAVAFIKIEED
jgi:hypothetical protein